MTLSDLDGSPAPMRCTPGGASATTFEAGGTIRTLDLFAAFWRDEAPAMDWLRHFLCDPATDALVERLANPPEDADEEDEILYSRSQLATLGSEIIDGP